MSTGHITLVTFDIDGTICVANTLFKGAAHKAMHHAAFSYALKTVCGFDDASINEVPHHGLTDPLILLKVQLHRGLSHEVACANLNQLKAAMIEYAMANEPPPTEENGLVLLPGVKDLLENLQKRPDVYVGLVTGNLEPIAWSKMQALGVRQFFSEPLFGGFGSDFCSMDVGNGATDRAQLVHVARKRLETILPDAKIYRCIHIGDAPNDVLAAQLAGATPIGVTTGIFSQQDLQEALPSCLVLENLAAMDQVLSALGLEA